MKPNSSLFDLLEICLEALFSTKNKEGKREENSTSTVNVKMPTFTKKGKRQAASGKREK